MEEQIQRAFDEYRSAVHAEQSLAEDIAKENRRPTPEEEQKFERMDEDIASAKREYERLLKIEKSKDDLDEARSVVEGLIAHKPQGSSDRKAANDAERLATAYRTVVNDGTFVAEEFDYTRRSIRSVAQQRALGVSAPAIDSTFVEQVLFYEVDDAPMLDPAIVNVLVTTRGETITWPRLTADANVAGTLTAEAAALNEADPSLTSVAFGAYKYGGITLFSAELDEDDVVGIEDVLAQSAARHIAEQANNPLTVADGSNKPNGIVNAAANGGTASGTANNPFFGPDDIIDLFYGRKAAYRRRGNWMAASTGMAKIRKLQDADGQKLWTPSLAPGQPETVLGRPIFENPDMAAVASASKSVLFGDTHRYVTRRVNGYRVEVSRDYKFNTDQIAIKTIARLDGDLLDANAVAYLVSANA